MLLICRRRFKEPKNISSPSKINIKNKYPDSGKTMISKKNDIDINDKKSAGLSNNSSAKLQNPYIKIIEEKKRKSKLIKKFSGDDLKCDLSKKVLGKNPRNTQEARTLTEISDDILLPKLTSKKKKKTINEILDF